jgi:hypothetical protein
MKIVLCSCYEVVVANYCLMLILRRIATRMRTMCLESLRKEARLLLHFLLLLHEVAVSYRKLCNTC